MTWQVGLGKVRDYLQAVIAARPAGAGGVGGAVLRTEPSG